MSDDDLLILTDGAAPGLPGIDVLAALPRSMGLHLGRTQRRAMYQMAVRFGIDPNDFPSTPEGLRLLWKAIQDAVGDGEITSSANRRPSIGDPFAVALECVCKQPHGGRGWHRWALIVKTEHRQADQAQAEDIIRFLKSEDRGRFCDGIGEEGEDSVCGAEVDTWSTHVGRVSEMAIRDGYAMELAE